MILRTVVETNAMQQFELLTGLPTSLSCTILRDWLKLKSVVALNSAFCCNSHRGAFLNLLQSNEYVIHETVTIRSTDVNMLRLFGKALRSAVFEEEFTVAHAESVITNCTNLRHLQLYRDSCTTDMWKLLNGNMHLESLNASLEYYRYPFFPVSFAEVVMPKLNTLVVRHYKERDKCLEDLLKTNDIVRLNLSSSKIRGSVLLQIPQLCPNLANLDLSSSTFLRNDVLNQFTLSCPYLVHLDISHNYRLTDEGIAAVVQNLTGLQSLSMGGGRGGAGITDASLTLICTYCADTLHTLKLSCLEGYPSYSSDAVNELLIRCTQLRTFYFADEYQEEMIIGDPLPPTIAFSPTAISHLTALILSGIVVNEQNIATIGKYGNNLKILSLNQSHSYTYHALKILSSGCPSLTELYLSIENNLDSEHFGMPNIYELSLLAIDLWKRLRPGLMVEQNSSKEPYYDVIKM